MHINMLMGIAERMTKMISGTFQIDKNSLLKVCCIMHLSKRYMYVECTEDWIEYEAIRILDSDDDNTKNPFKSILAIIIKQANELAYAIERERYNKAKNIENK